MTSKRQGPRYSASASYAARPSASEATPDELAATALDRPRLTVEMLAQWAEPRSAVPAPGALSSPASVPVVRGGRAPRVTMWIALTLLGVASGIAGAFLGVWLALG